MSGFKDLSLFDLALVAMLIVVNGTLSVALNLGLERKLLIAAVRTVVQLLLIGYVLGWMFTFNHTGMSVLPLMTVIAGLAASDDRGRRTHDRGRRTHVGQRDSIMSIWGSSWLIGAFGLFVVIRIHP